nr:glycoside hydrolase family 43 protein [uncultured Draconibacterium sp.]
MNKRFKIGAIFIVVLFSLHAGMAQSLQTIAPPKFRMRQGTPGTVPFDSLRMSDPFILADKTTQTYYLTSTGGLIWKSKDLKMWHGPFNSIEIDTSSWMGPSPMIWAAELHYYNGKYYYFATFTNSKITIEKNPERFDIPRRASHILIAEKAEGPYRPMKNNIYLPADQATLDGTLWIEDGIPYMIYCHEWLQIVDGTMDIIQLSPDLSEPVGKPKTIFKASDGPWSRTMSSIGEKTYGKDIEGQVTDGPFLFKTQTGKLGMLWSSWGDTRYAQGVAYSASGKLDGPWIHEKKALNPGNMGHGMLFHTFDEKLLMLIHYQSMDPKNPGPRKPVLLEVDDSGDKLKVIGKYKL